MSGKIPLFVLLGVMSLGSLVLILSGMRANAPLNTVGVEDTVDWYELRRRAQASRPAPQPAPRPWHEGGTLHDKTFAQWNAATSRNRLATAGDWIARIQLNEYAEVSDLDGPRMRELATELRDCVNGTTAGAGPEYGMASKPVSEAASMCFVMMWGTTPRRP